MTTRRRGLAVLALATAARFGATMLMGTAMAVYVGRRGSPFAVSLVFAAYFLGWTLFAPVWGAIADITGRRRLVLVVTGALATLTVLPLIREQGVWLSISLRGLYAVFAAGFPPIALTIASAHGGAEGRGRSLGLLNSARGAGFASGHLAAGVLLGLLVPSSLYLGIAIASLLATVAVVFVADPDGTSGPPADPSVRGVAREVRSRLVPVSAADRAHLRTNGLRWLYLAIALRNMSVRSVFSLLPPYLVGPVGVEEALMGAILAINSVGQMVCMTLFGEAADRVGRKPLVVVGMVGSGVFAVVIAAAALPADLAVRIGLAAGALVVIAVAYSALTTGTLAFIGDVAPADRESELMGLRQTARGAGGVLGPPILGAVATLAGYQVAFAGGSVLAFLAAGVVAVGLVESR